MATEKKKQDTVRLTHANGATVVVPKDRGEALVAAGNFSPEKTTGRAASKPATTDS